MNGQTSPSGSLFPYHYKGGELHCLKYGGFHNDETALFSRIDDEEEFFISSKRKLNTWIDLYETNVSRRVIRKLVDNIAHISPQVRRLALVGDFTIIRKLVVNDRLRRAGVGEKTAVRFFSDPEVAKTWIVTGVPNR